MNVFSEGWVGRSLKCVPLDTLYQKHLECLSQKIERETPRAPTETRYDEIPKSVYFAKFLSASSEHYVWDSLIEREN